MNTKNLVSIIIPCYNQAQYLEEAVQSALDQTYPNFEIIIVNDGSTDNTAEVASALQQQYPERIQVLTQHNQGLSTARNNGIALANGDFILPLDADDKIAPTYLEKAKKILDDDMQMGIVYCEAEFFGLNTGRWSLPPYSFPEILVGNMIFATAMYRKTDWEAVGGYNENMRHGNEDYDFWLSILELDRSVYQIPEILFSYRIKKHSMITKLASDYQNELNSYVQIFHNHKGLYNSNIKSLFAKIKQKQSIIDDKHQQILEKDRLILEKERLILEVHRRIEIDAVALNYQKTQIDHLHEVVSSMRLVNRAKRLVKKFIPQSVINLIRKIAPPDDNMATGGYVYQNPLLDQNTKKSIDSCTYKPLISIIMPVYNVDPKWLDLAIKSVENQWYENWELCIADDKSTNQGTLDYLKSVKNPKIKVKFLEQNLNISGASNAALTLTTGEYIALMDNDDEITPDALYEVVKAINETGAEFIYSDEDFLTIDTKHIHPHFKPNFSPDLLLSHNYITHLATFKKSLLDQVGTFRSEFDGSQDYDLFLRLTEKTSHIHHIPKVLYHWRMLESSTSADSKAKPEAIERGKLVLEETLQRRGINATVTHANIDHYFRVNYEIMGDPLVSIIIPFKDKPELLTMCIESILEKSTYQNFEIIGISNNSSEQTTFDEMKRLESLDQRVKFYEHNVPFNYSEINNYAVTNFAKGEHILLLNNDIEIITPDWIESMLEHSQREQVGCVGAKLYFPNNTIQHAGIIMGLGGHAGHSHKMSGRYDPGYFNRLNIVQNISGVTAACLMIKKSIYDELKGLDEVEFKIAYNDVDFCLRVLEAGYLNIFTPFAEAYHHESISRGYEVTPEKIARFQTEKDALFTRHRELLENGDPYYNPNLTLDREDFSLR